MTTLLVDGTNLLVRAVHAMSSARLSVDGETGEVNTGPILSFINMLSRYVREIEPQRMVVCWDGGRSSERMRIFSDYKVSRAEPSSTKPKDRDVFHLAKEFLTLAGIHHVEQDGVEADDLIAAYWRESRGDRGEPIVILSADKDFLQLVDETTWQVRPGTGDNEWWDVDRVIEKMGCLPENLRYVMALTGDSSDSIPGVRGFGNKTACKFLDRYDWDLARLLSADEPKLEGQLETVIRNLALVDLRAMFVGVDVPEAPKFDPTTAGSIGFLDLVDWLGRYQFESIKGRLISDSLWR